MRYLAQRIINLGLILCAIVGLSRSEYDERSGTCRDLDYRMFMPKWNNQSKLMRKTNGINK